MHKQDQIKLIDTHAHLDFPEIFNRMDEVILNAKENYISKIISISTNLNKIDKIISISENYADVFFTVGVHPNEVGKDINYNNYNMMKGFTIHPKCVGIGEGGLDYYYGLENKNKQKESFITQINVSRETDLPMVIHSRDADEDMIKILLSEYKKGTFKAVLHCFSSGEKLANIGIELGFYISFSGIVTFKSARSIQSIAKIIPIDKILIETDSPYLSPEPLRGKVNEPKNCYYTAKYLADLRGLSLDKFAYQTYQNSSKVFNKMFNGLNV